MSALVRNSPTSADILVVGGGPAGSALALLMARDGRNVHLVERSAASHDHMCGEFFSEEAIHYLAALEVDLRSMGALSISTLRLAANNVIAECTLPFPGLSLPRRLVDETLLQHASEAGAQITRGQRVEALNGAHGAWSARLSDGTEILAHDVFVATGKHDLRGYRRGRGKQNDLVAFKMYFALSEAEEANLRGSIELVLFAGGYAGLQLADDRCANLSLLIHQSSLRNCAGDWDRVLAHVLGHSRHLESRLTGAVPLLAKPLALSSIPYGYLRDPEPGAPWYLGDQSAVIPSFTGDGMSIALHTAFLAAEAYRKNMPAYDCQATLRRQLRRPVALATLLSRCMINLPKLAHVLRLHPSAMAWIAKQTRIPAHLRAGRHAGTVSLYAQPRSL